MTTAMLADLIRPAGRRAGEQSNFPVYSVTKHSGFVPSLEYFRKQVFSRDVEGYKLVEPGDFAYATIHLDEGSIGIAPERGLISPMYTVFRANESLVDADYLIRFLKSPRALAHYPQLGKGAVHRRKAISLAALGSLPIPLPPLAEQRRIAAILDWADKIRTKRRRIVGHLDALVDSVFMDMFAAKDFDAINGGTLMPSMRNGLSPATAGGHSATVLTLSSVTQGGFDPEAKKVGQFAAEPPADKRVSRRDFMMCRGNGNRSLVGVGTYSREDRPDLVFPDTVIAGRVDTSLVNMDYLEVAWRQQDVRSQIEAIARTTNGTFKVNQQTLSAVVVSVPPMDLQLVFAERAASVLVRRQTVTRALNHDDELFTSLQARAFRGEL
ncbi:MAG: hypothetical protein ABS63_08635 [Microbacterium sp. SCN 70-27]|uniref:restriction endonuclease subunit S n=1 Tax=unclassified Microbacterium TaxID=2609290 RepID=UPI00086ABD26|nr:MULTISPECIES: restriction endonuclease subunit S [unclassified Microbacterium]MBN9225465.1 restriction endonuclease subunit S [Microbacterium sp.]ODT27384.1 MAG: hypothetical protein ABS63_08635 [Microbacterium sp. SCN 70-27]